jgi:ribosomal protein S18 acetylase RimI-like enzyme
MDGDVTRTRDAYGRGMAPASTPAQVRPATHDDIPDLVELRGMLFAGLASGWGPPTAGEGWRTACADAFARGIAGDDMRIVVIDRDGTGGLAACGLGVVDRRLPSPYNESGLVGHVFGIVTRPEYRRRGYARLVTTALLRWFDDRGLTRVDLNASADGQSLYRSLGFAVHPDPAMRRQHDGDR